MSAPDFEIRAGIRAKRLMAHVPPDAQSEGEEVMLTRHELRSGVPATMEAGERYTDVVIDKRIVGQTQQGHTIDGVSGQVGEDRDPAAAEASDAGGRKQQQRRRRSSSRQTKRGTKLGSKVGSGASADSSSSVAGEPVTRSSTRKRSSGKQTARAPKPKNSSPRSRKRSTAVASSSVGEGLAEAVRNLNEGAAILREVRHNRRRS